jgi:hypothetical protein
MSRNGKIARPVVPHAARQAFARLDKMLAKSTLSDVEKIDRLRRAVFGELPEDGRSGGNGLQENSSNPTQSNL